MYLWSFTTQPPSWFLAQEGLFHCLTQSRKTSKSYTSFRKGIMHRPYLRQKFSFAQGFRFIVYRAKCRHSVENLWVGGFNLIISFYRVFKVLSFHFIIFIKASNCVYNSRNLIKIYLDQRLECYCKTSDWPVTLCEKL